MKKLLAVVWAGIFGFIFLTGTAGSVRAADNENALVLTAGLNQTLTLPNGFRATYLGLREDPFEHPKLVKNQGEIKYIAYREPTYFILEISDPDGRTTTYRDPVRGDFPAPIFIGHKKIVPVEITSQAMLLAYKDPDRDKALPGIPGMRIKK